MAPSHLPVVCLGEEHESLTHFQIEAAVLRRLRKFGYDTLAVEYGSHLEPAAHAYLASSRTPEDFRRFMAAQAASVLHPPPPEQIEAALAQLSQRPRKGAQLTKHLLDCAADLGYRVRFCDLASREVELAATPERIAERSRAMAAAAAGEVQAGHGTVLIVGLTHLLDDETMPSLSRELARHGVVPKSFALPPSPANRSLYAALPGELIHSIDRWVAGAGEIEKSVRRALKKEALAHGSFRRAGTEALPVAAMAPEQAAHI